MGRPKNPEKPQTERQMRYGKTKPGPAWSGRDATVEALRMFAVNSGKPVSIIIDEALAEYLARHGAM